MTQLSDFWAPFALTITCDDFHLCPVTDEDIPGLAELAHGGVRDPGVEAFPFNWDEGDLETVGYNLATYHWMKRATSRPDDWTVEFAVRVDGRLVGVQAIRAKNYAQLRSIDSGSWLARTEHRRGIGTGMRQVMATALFDHFGAEELTSAADLGNVASRRVSEKVGYTTNGTVTTLGSRGQHTRQQRFVLRKDALVRPHETVTVTGAERFRAFIGLKNEEE